MAVSAGAERQRRARRHARGDHSACLASRGCTDGDRPPVITHRDIAPPVTESNTGPHVTLRGQRGQELWDAMADTPLGPAHRVLLDEACRIVDRLDRLDAALAGRDAWLTVDLEQGQVVLVIDDALAESRQQATTLRGLVTEITKALPKAATTPSRAPAKKGGGLADLVALADRRRSTAG